MRRRRLFFGGCKGRLQKQRQHNDLPAVGSNFTQTIARMSAAGLVISSAGFGAIFAYTIGIEHGCFLAGLMVAMAVSLECLKPLAVASAFAAFGSWRIGRGLALSLLAAVAIGYSLTSELTLVAMTRGDLAARRASVIEQVDNRHTRLETARSELATLAPSRPVAEVKADVTKLLADNPRAGDCSALNGPVSRSVCPSVAALSAEIARTERRLELQAAIGKLSDATPAATVRAADPGATALATYLAAIGVTMPAGLLSEWLVLAPVLAIEIGAALAMVLVQAVSGQQRASVVEQTSERPVQTRPDQPQSVPNRRKPAQTGPEPDPNRPTKRTNKRTGKRTQRNAKRRLGNIVRLVQAKGGKVVASQQSLARQLRLSKTRVNELLHEAHAAGVVKLKTTKRGTSIVLAAA